MHQPSVVCPDCRESHSRKGWASHGWQALLKKMSGVYFGLFLKRKQETEVGHGECRGKAKGLNNYHGLYVSIGYRF